MAIRHNRKHRRGHEFIEFGLITLLFVPIFLGAMVTGLNLIRSIQANHTCRSLTNMYIHGADFSTYPMQQLAQRLGVGLNLQIGSSFGGNQALNNGNGGDGIITISRIMWVGGTNQPNCQGVGAGNCTNQNSFVLIQRIQFGNGSLLSESPATLGPTSATLTNSGIVQNPVTDANAKLQGAAQSQMQSLWQVTGNGRAPLTDGQIVYAVETYYRSSNFTFGSFTGNGVYARYFF